MRGLLLSSVLSVLGLVGFAGLTACGPSKPPADASNPPEEATTKLPPPTDDTPLPSTGAGGGGGGGSAPSDSPPPTAAPSTDSGPHLPPDFGGRSYDREAAEVVLRRAARQVKTNCGAASDDSGKANGPFGKTSVSVKMGHNGHSKSATIPAPYDGKPSGRCATQAFVNVQYPPFAGGDTVIEWEVEIVKPSGG